MHLEICAFCGKNIDEVEKLIKAPESDIFICNSCAEIVFDLSDSGINQKKAKKRREELAKAIISTRTVKKAHVSTPAEIHTEMDRFIVGQERAKKVLSVAVYNHAKRLKDKTGLIKKSNILLMGPTGCGKTLLAKTLARILDVPFAMIDATRLTEAGYIGDDVDTCLQRLLDAAGGDIGLAQKGIVFIDEIDKIACKGTERREVGMRGVQESLLKMVEGCVLDIPANGSRKTPNAKHFTIDTTNILFVCGGAFDGLINSQQKEKNTIGFCTGASLQEPSAENPVSTEALVKYGLLPELVGRLPVVCTLDGLTEEDFVRILTEPEDAIVKEYQLLLKRDKVNLIFEPDALAEVARTAAERNTGARGLRGILENLMVDIMYELPNQKDNISKCVVTADSIKSGQPLLITKRTRKQKNGGTDDPAQIRKEKAETKKYKEGGRG